jgi:hypothetical protein
MRSWQRSSSGPAASAEATYETTLAIRSFCETSSTDSDDTNRDISDAHVYHKLRYPNKGHMNEQNPKPSSPRLLAIGILIVQGQPSGEGIAIRTQGQIFYDPSGWRAHAHLPMIWRCIGLYHDHTTWVHLRVPSLANSPCPSSSKGECNARGNASQRLLCRHRVWCDVGVPYHGFKEKSAASLVALISQAVAIGRTRKGMREARRIPCQAFACGR